MSFLEKTVCRQLAERQWTGRFTSEITFLPDCIISQCDSSHHRVPGLLLQLNIASEKLIAALRVSGASGVRTLSNESIGYVTEVKTLLDEFSRLYSIFKDSRPPFPSLALAVSQFSGAKILKRLLIVSLLKSPGVAVNRDLLAVWTMTVDILRETCNALPSTFAANIAGDQELTACAFNLIKIFSINRCKNGLESIMGYLQETICAAEIPFDLNLVDFNGIVACLSRNELGLFSRILALMLHTKEELNGVEPQTSFKLLQSRVSGNSAVGVNQRLMVECPLLIARFVAILRWNSISYNESKRGLEYVHSYVNKMFSRSFQLEMRSVRRLSRRASAQVLWNIVNQVPETLVLAPRSDQWKEDLSHFSFEEIRGGPDWKPCFDDIVDFCYDELIKGGDEPGADHSQDLSEYQVEMIQEVMFVMSVLAGGAFQGTVNTSFCDNGLIPVLADMFDKLDWDDVRVPVHVHARGEECECNPFRTIKIQFLRMVHNFCNRYIGGGQKRLLLSEYDRHLLDSNSTIESLPACHSPETSKPGLLFKVVQVLLGDSGDYLFWLASSVEAFLRGGTPSEQVMICSWGLVSHLISEITDDGFKKSGLLQTNFDLLGELIKLNVSNMRIVEELLGETDMRKLTNVALSNLIDSNVFIRTLILSYECFKNSEPEFAENSKFGMFIEKNRLFLLRSLMTIVSLPKVNQENICCLNTALLILMFSNENGDLAMLLHSINEISEPDNDEVMHSPSGTPPLINFRKLLWFWNHYYNNESAHDKDSLAKSSKVDFVRWRDIVHTLCQDNGSPTSLVRADQILNLPTVLDL